jgi:4-alpha-glucanotransferase
MSEDPTLDRLAELAGILPDYLDLEQTVHPTSAATKRALLDAMGLDGDPAARLAELEAEAGRPVPRALAVQAATTGELSFPGWVLRLESGESHAGHGALPPLPLGLHSLEVADCEALLVAAPPRAPAPRDAGAGRCPWGMTAALYGLHSETRNRRLGDYGNLAVAAEQLAPLGADFLGINPVHALGTGSGAYSPYSPSHRGFLSTQHIALPEAVPGSETPPPDGLVDYGVCPEKEQALRRRFARFRDTTGDFAAFRARRGQALEDFALFEALAEVHGDDWRAWPAGFEAPQAPAARRFAGENPQALAFHAWLQWLADAQLGAAQVRARAAGMSMGLYTDMAVGVRPGGAEVWARPDVFARGVSLGAPPDHFNPQGQTWGLAPLSPLGLARAGFRPFIETMRGVLRHAGLARIDHVLGLARCFWVPEGGPENGDAPGGYVRYPLELLLAIVRLEATRLGCVVVGEDLGNVPDGLRERLDASRLYGCTVMQFERDPHGELSAPRDHRASTLASYGTHDTPTLKGWWEERDIAWRLEFGQFDGTGAEAERAGRARDRRRLMALLAEEGLWPDHPPPPVLEPPLAAALHALLGRSNAELLAVQLDDALGVLEQPNFPGTTVEHPNWRRRCPCPVERLGADPTLRRVAAAVGQARRQHGQSRTSAPA